MNDYLLPSIPLSSASCPVLSLLINPSITFLVSFHALQAWAFTEWQLNKTLWECVCVCLKFPPDSSAVRNLLSATLIHWRNTANSEWHLGFLIRRVQERSRVFSAGGWKLFQRRVQQQNVDDSFAYSGQGFQAWESTAFRSNANKCLFWASWLQFIIVHTSFTELTLLFN